MLGVVEGGHDRDIAGDHAVVRQEVHPRTTEDGVAMAPGEGERTVGKLPGERV